MPYAIHRLSEFDHTSLYFTDIQKIIDNVWPFWGDFTISLEIIFIPAGAPEYSWNSQASRFLATLLQDQSLFLESMGHIEKGKDDEIICKITWKFGENESIFAVFDPPKFGCQFFQAPAGHPQKIHGFETKFTRSFHQGIYCHELIY